MHSLNTHVWMAATNDSSEYFCACPQILSEPATSLQQLCKPCTSLAELFQVLRQLYSSCNSDFSSSLGAAPGLYAATCLKDAIATCMCVCVCAEFRCRARTPRAEFDFPGIESVCIFSAKQKRTSLLIANVTSHAQIMMSFFCLFQQVERWLLTSLNDSNLSLELPVQLSSWVS